MTERVEARLLRIDQAIERLDADLVLAREEADERVDDRIRSHRREWKTELAAFRDEWKEELAATLDARDASINDRIAAATKGLAAATAAASTEAIRASEERLLAAIGARNQVPAWLAGLTPGRVAQFGAATAAAAAAVLAAVGPFVLALVASCQGHPTEYRVPVPAPLQFSQPDPSGE